jgi:hypothetical protein
MEKTLEKNGPVILDCKCGDEYMIEEAKPVQ